MATKFELNNTTPAAPGGRVNVAWQSDAAGNVSAHVATPGGGSGGHTIQEEGTPLTARTGLNFVGAGVAATDDAANDRTLVTIPGGAGHTIQEEGTPLTARAGLNFVGPGVVATDDAANNRTLVTIAGTGGKVTHGYTFAVLGDLTAITVLPSFFVPFAAPQSVILVGAAAKIASGTSIGVQVKHNGSNVGSVFTVTPTTTYPTPSIVLSNGSELTIVLSSPVGTPTTLSVTLILEHTL